MNITDINKTHKNIMRLLINKKIADALFLIKQFVENLQSEEFNTLIENSEYTYNLVLKYSIKGVQDPQRPHIVNQLIKTLLELNDRIKEVFLEKNAFMISSLKKTTALYSKSIVLKINEIQKEGFSEKEFSELFEGLHIESATNDMPNHSKLINDYFNYVWLTDAFTEEDIQILRTFFNTSTHQWHFKAIIESALSLNAIRYFSPSKILLLAELSKSKMPQIAERAFVGLMLSLYVHEERLAFYPEIEAALSMLSEGNPQINFFTDFFTIQMIKASDTEKFTKKFRDEIMPDIIKYAPDIKDKLDLDNILPEDMEEGKNPDWQKILGDNQDLLSKLEELSKLQMEGTDVFMSTFAMLKHFNFFRQMSNWFLPFYKENETVMQLLNNESDDFKEIFLASLEKSGHMCNSDKYSFCLNVKELPDAQKNMMLNMFKQELESINELNDSDELLNKSLVSKKNITHYIQDIYRFYKLFPQKHEFKDVFSLKLDFYNKTFFRKYFSNTDLLVKIADFYFDNNHFEQAAEIYTLLINENLNTQVVFEKAGFAYQQNKNFEKAIDCYKKAELFETTVWLSLKMAYCFTKLNMYKEALYFYTEAENLEPENLKIQLNIANTYLSMGDFTTALNHYYKLELLAASNIKVLRPISWCLFVLGRFDEAKKYFEQLIASQQANNNDYMNYAHLLWCLQKSEEAASFYLKSINKKDFPFSNFIKSFEEDKKYLIKHGIEQEDILLMLDYLKINRAN